MQCRVCQAVQLTLEQKHVNQQFLNVTCKGGSCHRVIQRDKCSRFCKAFAVADSKFCHTHTGAVPDRQGEDGAGAMPDVGDGTDDDDVRRHDLFNVAKVRRLEQEGANNEAAQRERENGRVQGRQEMVAHFAELAAKAHHDAAARDEVHRQQSEHMTATIADMQRKLAHSEAQMAQVTPDMNDMILAQAMEALHIRMCNKVEGVRQEAVAEMKALSQTRMPSEEEGALLRLMTGNRGLYICR